MSIAVDRLRSLQVRDVMTVDVVCVTTRQSMGDAANLLRERELSSAPVVDDGGSCVGFISASDFMRRDAALAKADTTPRRERPAWTPDDVVETFMSTGVQTILATASLLQAARVLCAQHVHRLPAVDDSGKLVGVISTMDITSAMIKAVSEEERSTG